MIEAFNPRSKGTQYKIVWMESYKKIILQLKNLKVNIHIDILIVLNKASRTT